MIYPRPPPPTVRPSSGFESDPAAASQYGDPIPVVIGTARVKGTPLLADSIRAATVLLPDAQDPATWTEQEGKVVTGVLGLCEGPIPPQSQTNLVWFDKWAGSRVEAGRRIVSAIDTLTGGTSIFYLGAGNPQGSADGRLVMYASTLMEAGRISVGDYVYVDSLKRDGWVTRVDMTDPRAIYTSVPMSTAEAATRYGITFYRSIEVDAGSRTGSDFFTTSGYSTLRYTALNNSGAKSVLTLKSDSAVPVAGDYLYCPSLNLGDTVESVTGGTTVTMASKRSWPTPSGYAALDLYHVATGVTWDSATRAGVVHFAGTATARSRAWVTQDGKIDNLEFEVTGMAASQPASVSRPKAVCSPTTSKTPTQVTVVTGGTGVTTLTLGAGETDNLAVGDKLTQGAASSTIYAVNRAAGTVTLDTAGTWATGVAEVTVPRTVLDAHPADAVVAVLTDPVWGLGWSASQVDVDHGADLAAASGFRTYATAMGFRISGVLDTKRSAKEIVRSILEACNAVPVETTIGGLPAIRVIPWGDDAVTANGVTYTPPAANPYPVSEIHIVQEEGQPPIRIERGSRQDIPNVCPVTYLDRDKDYDQVTVEYMDAARVEDDGRVRRASALDLPWTIPGTQALALSQALVQRAGALTNTLTFTLPPTYAFLEPMDFLSISHTLSGYSDTTIRVTALDEDADGQLVVTACEWPLGIGRTALHEAPVVEGSGGGSTVYPTGILSALAAIADDGVVTPQEADALITLARQVGSDYFNYANDVGPFFGRLTSAQLTAYGSAWFNLTTALSTSTGLNTNWIYHAATGAEGVDPEALAAWRASLPRPMVRDDSEPTDGTVGDWWRAQLAAYQAAADTMRAQSESQVVAAGSSTVRPLPVRFGDTTNVLDFEDDGVDASGNADSTAGFAAAAAACVAKGGGDILIPAGEFLLADLPSPSGVRWVGQGAGRTKLKRLNAGGSETFLVKFNGTVGSTSNLSGNVNAGDYACTVGNGTLFAVNSWALIREGTYTSASVGRKQQIVRVVSVSSNTVYFDRPLFEGYYTSATAQLCVLSPVVDAGIFDCALEGVNATGKGGIIRAQYAIGLGVEGTVAQYFSGVAGYSLSTCLDSHLRNVVARDGVGVSTAGQGWGAEFDEACAFCSIEDSRFENVREVAFTNRTAWSKFLRNTSVGNYDSGFNTHGAYVNHIDIEGNQVLGVRSGVGLAVGYGSHQQGDEHITIRGNTVRGAGYGIIVQAPSGKENRNITIDGNRILAKGFTYGVAVVRSNVLRSQGNVVDYEGGSTSYGAGFYLIEVNRGRLVGDWVRNATTTYGFRYDTCTDVDFDACETDTLDSGLAYKSDGTHTRVNFRRATTFTP